jgi:adenylate cyclase
VRRASGIRRLLFAGVALVAIGAALAAWSTDVGRGLELGTVDTRFDVRGPIGAPDDIVFVAVDDATFQELREQWPFARTTHAEAIDRLRRDGARVIAYDVQFSEPAEDVEADFELAEAIRRAGNVVLATTEVNEEGRGNVFPWGFVVDGREVDALEYSRGTAANSNVPNDEEDGTTRRLLLSADDLRSFPVVSAEKALGRRVDEGRFEDGAAWIDFHGPPGTFEEVSFSTVVRGRFRRGTFRDKIVVVGASAPTLQDLHDTATSGTARMPGPEVHANAISTVLRDFPLREAPGWLPVLAIALFGLLPPAAALRLRPLLGLAIALLAGAAYLVAAQLAFEDGTILAVVHPLAALALATVGTLVMHYVTVAFERERVRDAFARFVPENVVDEVLSRADGVRLGGVQREGTVMFSDLRGFTSFAESRPVDQVIGILNRYLGEMSEAILDHGGTLVAYMGDGIMAVFGAPIEQPDHADRALAAAREMLERLERFNAWMRAQGLGDGFKMGIGLNSGPVMSGNVGSERRLEYTAIGDTTNTAARIEGMTKGTPYQLFVADSTRTFLKDVPADLVDAGEREVRGREAKIRLWGLEGDVAAPTPAEQPA